MKKTGFILSVLALIVIILYRVFLADEFQYSEYSPDKQYRVDVYAEKRFWGTMPGDGGNRTASVVLRNKWGFPIGRCNCDCYLGEIDIKWYSWEVEVSILQSINLKTGKCGNN
jgi:hypothetical protein